MKIACICLTADRQEQTDRAVRCFLAQTYHNKELLILDSGEVAYRPPKNLRLGADVSYLRIQRSPEDTIGSLRNFANEVALQRPAVKAIAHWDSDDWSFSGRLEQQAGMISSPYLDGWVTGYSQMLFWDSVKRTSWLFTSTEHNYCLGTSLLYRREAWERFRFPHTSKGEEDAWQRRFYEKRLACIWQSATPPMVAELHPGNTCSRMNGAKEWTHHHALDCFSEVIMDPEGIAAGQDGGNK